MLSTQYNAIHIGIQISLSAQLFKGVSLKSKNHHLLLFSIYQAKNLLVHSQKISRVKSIHAHGIHRIRTVLLLLQPKLEDNSLFTKLEVIFQRFANNNALMFLTFNTVQKADSSLLIISKKKEQVFNSGIHKLE